MKKIVALAAAVLLSVGAQATTGHHAPKAKTVSAHAGAKTAAKAHKPTLAKAAGKKAQAHKHGAQKHAALKAPRKAGHKHA
jgi:hypothetical protein